MTEQTTPSSTVSSEDVIEAMKDVIDPELGINVVDLGLVYGVNIEDGNAVVGTFHYAFEPADWNSPEIWAGSTHMGSGEYAELAANKFEFLLCRGEDGVWTCVSVATGGVQLP